MTVAVFTVTVLWKAAAAMSSHRTICQRGCFSILGIDSEIHRPIHTSQIDMLAQTQSITNINSEMAQESVQRTVSLPSGWISVKMEFLLPTPASGFPISFSGETGGVMSLAPPCNPIGCLGPIPAFSPLASKCLSGSLPGELQPISHMTREIMMMLPCGFPLMCPSTISEKASW